MTGFQDVYEDLKMLTDSSFWRRIFKAPKNSFLDVLKPKLDALFEVVKYCLQYVFTVVLKTSLEDWPWRRVWRLENDKRPVVLKTYLQSPQDQLSKRVEAQAWRPFHYLYSSRSQQYHSWIFRTSVYKLNTVCNTSTYTSWRGVSKNGLQNVYEDLKTLTNPSFLRHIFN